MNRGIRSEAINLLADLLYPQSVVGQHRELARAARILRMATLQDISGARAPASLRSPWWNFITVAKEGGDFDTITDALIAIEDPSSINRYCIFVYPGTYDEQVVLKEYVALVGLDRDVCVIQSDDHEALVTMASHSALNELTIENTRSAGGYAVYANGEDEMLIDSCIIKASGNTTGNVYGVEFSSCADWRVVGSEIEVYNANTGGENRCFDLPAGSAAAQNGEIRYCRAELTPASRSHGAVVNTETLSTNASTIRVLDCYLRARNNEGEQDGVEVIAATGNGTGKLYVENTTIEHVYSAGGGYDIDADGANAYAYPGRCRYATYIRRNGGHIDALPGDMPVVEKHHSFTNFTITAAAGVYEDDTESDFTFDTPCKSDIVISASIIWTSPTVRTQSFKAHIHLDGAEVVTSLGYAGMAASNTRQIYSLTGRAVDIGCGTHTAKIRVARNNAADTVVVEGRELSVISAPKL